MKAELYSKISSYIFIVLMVVTAVVLVMFYGVGYDNQSAVTGGAYVTDPQYTDLLMYWMYALMAITIISVAVFGLLQFGANMVANPKSAIKSLGALLAMVALFVVAYAFSSTEPILINGVVFEDTTILLITDVCLYVLYILLAVSLASAIFSLLGVFKMFNKVKA
ncbi:MAG: hypothetical protein E7087_04060 [Bacteroidales bacterium]|nr:hypothetical protein [Bacteroidales bacterium]MBO5263902.1 hypothetical protein [Bacteroidaceae bacterium]